MRYKAPPMGSDRSRSGPAVKDGGLWHRATGSIGRAAQSHRNRAAADDRTV